LRKTLTTILILTFTISFSQTKRDISEIIELIIAKESIDYSRIYYKFDNYQLLSRLNDFKRAKDEDIKEKYRALADSAYYRSAYDYIIQTTERIISDTITVKLRYDKFYYRINIEKLEQTSTKQIKRYVKSESLSKIKKTPYISISFPIFSTDNKKAIVYKCTSDFFTEYVPCTSLGYYIIEKENNIWKIKHYQYRW